MKAFLLSILYLILLLVGGLVIFLYSGLYSVAAVEEHTAGERWALETAKRASVERRAAGIEVPDLRGRDAILRGAGAYAAMCATCHGAPGVDRSAMGRGLNPLAPGPGEFLRLWSPAEIFWITKHGIRMTGMPAWGLTHTDEQLWEIVACLRQMEAMTAQEYQAILAEAPAHDHDDKPRAPHEHEQGHEHRDRGRQPDHGH